MLKITWLEELASESNTIQAQEDITQRRRQQAQTQENYMYVSVGFSLISLDQCVRLGSRLLWSKSTSVCFSGFQWCHSENACGEDWGETRFAHMMSKVQILPFGDSRQAQMDVSGPRGPR